MNIYFDSIIYSLQKSGGISLYWQKLLESIPVSISFLYNKCNSNIFYNTQNRHTNEVRKKKIIFIERYFNTKYKTNKFFIFHSSYYRYCKNKKAINITTVHDFTYEYFRNDLKSIIHKFQKKNAVKHSDGIICISENTKKDLYKFYPNYKGNVKVIYHGFDSTIFNYKGNNYRNNNVLFVGARTSYKGFDFTIRLLSELPSLNLIIIGGGALTETEKKILNSLIQNRYEKKEFVSNEELSKLYNESFALMYPSEYEGFGFPVIEAQACGCPVICQKKSSIPEVSGNKCVYVDSCNFSESISNINKMFDKKFYERLQNEGLENVRRFSWETCIKQTQDFYEECYNKKIKDLNI